MDVQHLTICSNDCSSSVLKEGGNTLHFGQRRTLIIRCYLRLLSCSKLCVNSSRSSQCTILRYVRYRCSCRLAGLRQRIRRCRRHSRHSRRSRHSRHIQSRRHSRQSYQSRLAMPLLVVLVKHIPLSIVLLQQLMLQQLSWFGS